MTQRRVNIIIRFFQDTFFCYWVVDSEVVSIINFFFWNFYAAEICICVNICLCIFFFLSLICHIICDLSFVIKFCSVLFCSDNYVTVLGQTQYMSSSSKIIFGHTGKFLKKFKKLYQDMYILLVILIRCFFFFCLLDQYLSWDYSLPLYHIYT